MSTFKSREMNGAALTCPEFDIALGAPLYNQVSHGFALGDVVRENGIGVHTKARANTTTAIGVGLALVIHVVDSDNFVALKAGGSRRIAWSAHGLTPNTYGTKLYLSQATLGLMTTTEPSSGFIVYLGYVGNANTIYWEPGLKVTEI